MFNIGDKVFYLDYDTIYEVTIKTVECYGFGKSVHKVQLDRILDSKCNFKETVCLADVDNLFATSDEAKNELERREKIVFEGYLREMKTAEDLLKFPFHHNFKDDIYGCMKLAYILRVKELLKYNIPE